MKEEPAVPKAEDGAQETQPRPPGGPCGSTAMAEDEISLLDLFIVLLKHKGMIVFIVLLTGIAALVISLRMTEIYRSECTIAPTQQERISGLSGGLAALGGLGAMIASEMGIGASGSLDQFDVVLKSRELTNTIVQQHDLLPLLFEEAWDDRNKRWKVGKPSLLQQASSALRDLVKPDEGKNNRQPSKFPTLDDAYRDIQERFRVSPDRKQNVMRLSFEHRDPKIAQAILTYYVTGLSEFLRGMTVEETAAQRAHLTEQLAKTTDPLLKSRLYELISKLIEKEALAKIQRNYSFNIIDPAFVPDKKFKPKRAQICILSVVVAFFFAVFLAFFLEYLQNLGKKEVPERLAALRDSLWIRRRS